MSEVIVGQPVVITTPNVVPAGSPGSGEGVSQAYVDNRDAATLAASKAYTDTHGGGGGGVPTTRTISAGTGLTGGGDLSANRTLAVDFAAAGSTAAGKAVEASDARLPTGSPTTGQVPTWDGTKYAPATPSGGGGGAVTSVAGKTGAVTLVKGDVGLGNVDNTSDTSKPVSTAQQAALNAKADAARTITAGTGLTGGGSLAADRTLAVSYGTAAGTAAQGNDSRLNDSRTPTAHAASHARAGTDALQVQNLGSGSATAGQVATADGAGGVSFAAPGAGVPMTQIDDFAATGTWNKPSGAKSITIICVGAGGGGGSGRRGAAGTVRCGGGGGGAGAVSIMEDLDAAALPGTLSVQVGSKGLGGSGMNANDQGGTAGTVGGLSRVLNGSDALCSAGGGSAGQGGTATTGTGGAGGTAGQFAGTAGGAASTSGAVGTSGTAGAQSTGGGAGGGITTGDAVIGGGGGGMITRTQVSQGVSAAGADGAAGLSPVGSPYAGGGQGGGSSKTAAAGAGGDGGTYGGGGGGGGASLNGFNSGKGGNGANGFVRIITHF